MVLYCDATNVQGQVTTLRLTTPTTDKCVMATTRNGNPGHKNPLTREKAKMPYVNTSHFGHHAGQHSSTRQPTGTTSDGESSPTRPPCPALAARVGARTRRAGSGSR